VLLLEIVVLHIYYGINSLYFYYRQLFAKLISFYEEQSEKIIALSGQFIFFQFFEKELRINHDERMN